MHNKRKMSLTGKKCYFIQITEKNTRCWNTILTQTQASIKLYYHSITFIPLRVYYHSYFYLN